MAKRTTKDEDTTTQDEGTADAAKRTLRKPNPEGRFQATLFKVDPDTKRGYVSAGPRVPLTDDPMESIAQLTEKLVQIPADRLANIARVVIEREKDRSAQVVEFDL